MTTSQLQIMRHALGYDDAGHLRSDSAGGHRNHFVSPLHPDLTALCQAGLMRNCGNNAATGGLDCYRVTDSGRKIVLDNKPDLPMFTRSQQRYRDFLRLDLGWTFREYLAHLTVEKRANQ